MALPKTSAMNLSESPRASEGVADAENETEETHSVEEQIPTPATAPTTTYSSPYTLTPLPVQIPSLEEDGRIVCVEAWENNLYLGTDRGQIVHCYKLDDAQGYIQISKQWIHQTKRNPVRRIVVLSEIGRVCVLYGRQLTCLSLPELSPANIGKVKDIGDVGVNWTDLVPGVRGNTHVRTHSFNGEPYCELLALTTSTIRMLRIFKDSIRLHKDVPIEGTRRGAQCGNHVALVRDNQFELVDVARGQRVPLFAVFTNSQVTADPQLAVLNNNEFLLLCGGENPMEQSMGMCINKDGDITRSTLTWDAYPNQVVVDFPYVITADAGQCLKVHSLHEQHEVTQLQLGFVPRLSHVLNVFKTKDPNMVEKATLGPFISKMDSADIERVAEEFDKANKDNLIETSVLVNDDHGKQFMLLRPISKIDRWLQEYHTCTPARAQFVFDKLMDEARGSRDKFLVSLLGMLCLKFELVNQLFEIWYANCKVIDPRLLVYIMDKDSVEFGRSVWTYNGLFDIVEDLKRNMVVTPPLEEFYKLYLSSCLSLTFARDQEDILGSVEIAFLKRSLDSRDALEGLVAQLRYSKNAAVETLLFAKRYWTLCQLYRQLGLHSQYLYYYKGLVTGEFLDAWFMQSKEEAMGAISAYLQDHCVDNFELLWEYATWLLEEAPKTGLMLVMSEKLRNSPLNEVQVLKLLGTSTYQHQYLQYLYQDKGETQFLGDLTITSVKNTIALLDEEPGLKEEIQGAIAQYQRLEIPRMSFERYWQDYTLLDRADFCHYHRMAIACLDKVGPDTNPVIVGAGQPCVEVLRGIVLSYAELLPLIAMRVLSRPAAVDLLCQIGDFNLAEERAKGNPVLEGVIFERYLALGRGPLLDRFLRRQEGGLGGDSLARTERFLAALVRVPDDVTARALRGFLLEALGDLDDAGSWAAAQVALRRSALSGRKNWVI